jgi:hypothetical protein
LAANLEAGATPFYNNGGIETAIDFLTRVDAINAFLLTAALA